MTHFTPTTMESTLQHELKQLVACHPVYQNVPSLSSILCLFCSIQASPLIPDGERGRKGGGGFYIWPRLPLCTMLRSWKIHPFVAAEYMGVDVLHARVGVPIFAVPERKHVFLTCRDPGDSLDNNMKQIRPVPHMLGRKSGRIIIQDPSAH